MLTRFVNLMVAIASILDTTLSAETMADVYLAEVLVESRQNKKAYYKRLKAAGISVNNKKRQEIEAMFLKHETEAAERARKRAEVSVNKREFSVGMTIVCLPNGRLDIQKPFFELTSEHRFFSKVLEVNDSRGSNDNIMSFTKGITIITKANNENSAKLCAELKKRNLNVAVIMSEDSYKNNAFRSLVIALKMSELKCKIFAVPTLLETPEYRNLAKPKAKNTYSELQAKAELKRIEWDKFFSTFDPTADVTKAYGFAFCTHCGDVMLKVEDDLICPNIQHPFADFVCSQYRERPRKESPFQLADQVKYLLKKVAAELPTEVKPKNFCRYCLETLTGHYPYHAGCQRLARIERVQAERKALKAWQLQRDEEHIASVNLAIQLQALEVLDEMPEQLEVEVVRDIPVNKGNVLVICLTQDGLKEEVNSSYSHLELARWYQQKWTLTADDYLTINGTDYGFTAEGKPVFVQLLAD